MATFMENIKTIETAVYGKEMRPAIVEALTSAKNKIVDLTEQSRSILQRIEDLSGDPGGGGDTPEPTSSGAIVTGGAEVSITCSIIIDIASGEAIAV